MNLSVRLTILMVMPCCRGQALGFDCVVFLDQSFSRNVCGHQISLAILGG